MVLSIWKQDCHSAPKRGFCDSPQSQKKMGKASQSGSRDTFYLVSYNTQTTLLRSFKWRLTVEQENITAYEGKHSPTKISCHPVNPLHRESIRSCLLQVYYHSKETG